MRALRVLMAVAVFMALTVTPALASHEGATMEMPGGGGMQEQTFTKHYENSLFQITVNGLYSVELVVTGGMMQVGSNTMDIIIHDRKDRDVKGAKITVKPWMPDMEHGVPEVPVITERGGGRYTAEMVNVSMPGLWELQVTVEADAGKDTAIFRFPDVMTPEDMGDHQGMEDMSHEGMTGMGAEGEVNYSHTVTSKKGMFTVTYDSEIKPVPVRSIHQWRLDIADKDGNPVDGAEIEVSGSMPAHGHGLPTKPEATPEGGGLYLLEGMSFSMPGYWTVTVRIHKDGMEDSATFNLDLK